MSSSVSVHSHLDLLISYYWIVLMALWGSSSTWGNLVLDDLFLQLTRAPPAQSLSDLLTQAPPFTTFGEGKPCPNSHTYSSMAHHTLLKIHVVIFDISPCLSLSDTLFFPSASSSTDGDIHASCGCWEFLSTSLNLGLPEDTSLSLFCCKLLCVFALFVTHFVFFDLVICWVKKFTPLLPFPRI